MIAAGGVVEDPDPIVAAYLDLRRFGTLPQPHLELPASDLEDLRAVADLAGANRNDETAIAAAIAALTGAR